MRAPLDFYFDYSSPYGYFAAMTIDGLAAKHGRSAEAEHREILASALRKPRKRKLAEALAAIPHVGADEDFARIEDAAEAKRVPG